MGWLTHCGYTKQMLVDHILDPSTYSEGVEVLDHSLRGNQLWVLARTPDGVVINLYLLGYDRSCDGYGYKGISEGMGPLYYDVPQKFLNQADTDINPKWRATVAWHRALRTGLDKAKKQCLPVVDKDGNVYRLQKFGRYWAAFGRRNYRFTYDGCFRPEGFPTLDEYLKTKGSGQ